MTSPPIQMLRSSERSTFKRCPQQWHWSYVEGLRQNGDEALALWFGTGMHLVWAEYYVPGFVRGRDPHSTWDEYCEGYDWAQIRLNDDQDGYEVFMDARTLGHMMIDGYLAEYGSEPHIEVIASEQRVQAILPHHKDLTRAYVDLRGTMDCIVRDHRDNTIRLMDHKHMARVSIKHLGMDEQLAGYTTVAEHSLRRDGLIGPKERVDGIWYNLLRKAKPDERPRDDQGRYRNSPTKPMIIEALLAELEYTEDEVKALKKLTKEKLLEEAEANEIVVLGEISKLQGSPRFIREWVPFGARRKMRQITRLSEDMFVMNAVRAGKLPLQKFPGEHCSWCPFIELCEMDEDGVDTEDFKKTVYHVEDPYADHRDGAENSKATVLLKRKTGVN